MFKKFLSILIAAIMAMSLFSCDDNTAESADNDSGKKRKPKTTGTIGTGDEMTGVGTEDGWHIPGNDASDDEDGNYDDNLKMYSDYLLGGKLDGIISENYLDNPSVHYCLIDLNEDGTYELLLSLKNAEPGPRGYASVDYLFGIVNGSVTDIKYEFNGGGSMGGSNLVIRYDADRSRHTVVTSGMYREGMWADFGIFTAYEYTGSDVSVYVNAERTHLNIEEESHAAELYAHIIDEVKSTNSYYKEEDDYFYCYKLDGGYVSEDEYNSVVNRFVEPTDSRFIMKEGTLDNPLGVK